MFFSVWGSNGIVAHLAAANASGDQDSENFYRLMEPQFTGLWSARQMQQPEAPDDPWAKADPQEPAGGIKPISLTPAWTGSLGKAMQTYCQVNADQVAPRFDRTNLGEAGGDPAVFWSQSLCANLPI